MHNTYFSSTIYAVRCKESISLSYSGYSNFCYDRFDRTQSHCSSRCCCCDCCALSTYRVPIKPSLLNGLRQSTLLNLSTSRRLILGGRGQYFSWLPVYGLHRGCYELNCSVNEKTVCIRNRNKIKGRYFHAASQKGREICNSFDSDDAEAVLSLLSEDVEKDAIGIKWKNTSSKRTEAEKKRRNVNRERNLSLSKKAETQEKGNLKQHVASAIDLKREDEKPIKDREATTKSENYRKRRDLSSCSSYYSFSSGDFESDVEVQDKYGFEELSVGYEKNDTNHVEGQVKEEFKSQRDDSEKLQGVSNAFGTDIDWNLRKKSEKKLTDVTVQESEFTKGHQDMNSTTFRTHESTYGKASISQMQVESEENNSSFAKDLDKKTKKAYIQTGNLRKHHFTDIQESGGEEVEITLLSQKAFSGSKGNHELSETLLQETSGQHKKLVGSTSATGQETSKSKKTFSGREGNLEISETLLQETSDEHKKFLGSPSTAGKDVINRNSQKYFENSKIEDTKKTSNTRMKNLGAKEVLDLSSNWGVEEQQHQKEEKIVAQAKGRRKSQQVHESNVEDTSIIKSRTRVKNSKENSNLSTDARGTLQQTDNTRTQNFQHREGSDLVITSSEDHASDEKQCSSSHRTSEKVRFSPKSKLKPVVKTRESSCQTDERITDFEFGREDQRPSNLSMFEKNASREESGFQGSMTLVSESGSRGSAHFEFTTGISSPEIILETSESGSSALYDNSGKSPAFLSGLYYEGGSDQGYSEPSNNMAPEDALGSADRLEKSSKLFVGEFVERVRHEVTTSETQEVEVTGTKLAFEDERNKVYSSRHQGTQNDSLLKEHDSSHSSGFPGAKGPSDEMWDVTEPSVERSQEDEETEIISKETDQLNVSRTGRSLWSMIANVVRFRWGSCAGSSTSAGRSGERNSPNKSDSETWFSGQEHEETSKSNVIKDTSVPPQTMTSDKLKLGKHYTQTEGEVSDIKKIKDKGKQVEVGSSSPNVLESGSVDASYASGEENASWTEDGKDLKVTTSGIKNMELPIALPAREPPLVGEIASIGGSDMSGTEPVVPISEPVAPVQSELSDSGRKDGELKQRKLQRNRQVLRDRFDDWEEAYKLELEQRRMDEMFMKEALLEAKKAGDTWEVPVGAVLVQHGKIIARGFNLVEELRDSTAHAEMICIREASKLLRTWRLADTTLYVTLEPCPMCAGAILQARIDTVVWGAPNKLLGADGSWIRLFPDGGENVSEPRDMPLPPAPIHPFHPKMKIRRGVLATECAEVMQQFFQLRRKTKEEDPPKDLSDSHHHPSKFLNKMHNIFHMIFCL